MTETSRMAASLVGILIGAIAGAAAVYTIFRLWEPIYNSPGLMLVTILGLGGGLAVLGGYLALLLMNRLQKSRRRRRSQDKKEHKFNPAKTRPKKR